MASQALTPREQITDLITRALLAIDTNNPTLWNTIWSSSPTASFHLNGNILTGLEEINAKSFSVVAPMDTQHLVSNFRVEFVGEGAKMTASAMAMHYRKGEGMVPGAERLLAGNMYEVDVVKEGEEWKILKWVLKIVWAEGSFDVMKPVEAS